MSFREKAAKSAPYMRNLISELFFGDPETLLLKFPSVRRKVEEDPYFRERVREVAESHRDNWKRATELDMYDAAVSAAQLASLLVTFGYDIPVERLVEIAEILPKLPYIYDYSKRAGYVAAAALALYELISLVDPTNLMDILPAYRVAELYNMYRELIPNKRGKFVHTSTI